MVWPQAPALIAHCSSSPPSVSTGTWPLETSCCQKNDVVKICDFGLARDIYKDPDYVRKGSVSTGHSGGGAVGQEQGTHPPSTREVWRTQPTGILETLLRHLQQVSGDRS